MATSRILSTHFDVKPVLTAEQIAAGYYVHTYPADPGERILVQGNVDDGSAEYVTAAPQPEYWAIIAPYDIYRGNTVASKISDGIRDIITHDPIRAVDIAIMDKSSAARLDIIKNDPVAAYEQAMSADGGNSTDQLQMQTRTAAVVGAIILTAGGAVGSASATAETGAAVAGAETAAIVEGGVAAGEAGELIATALAGTGGGTSWAEIAATVGEYLAGAKTAYGYAKDAYGAYSVVQAIDNKINPPDRVSIPTNEYYPAPGTDFKTEALVESSESGNNRFYLSAILLAVSLVL